MLALIDTVIGNNDIITYVVLCMCWGLLNIWPFKRRNDTDPSEEQRVEEAQQLSVDDYIDWGVRLASLERYERAEDKFRHAIESEPDNAAAHYNLGLSLSHQSNVFGAVEAYKRALELAPESVMVLTNYGLALLNAGDTGKAVDILKHAAELQPDDSDSHFNLGMALLGTNDVSEAIVSFRKAVEMKPDDPKLRFNLGLTLRSVGSKDESTSELNEFLLLSTQDNSRQRRYAESLLNKEAGKF